MTCSNIELRDPRTAWSQDLPVRIGPRFSKFCRSGSVPGFGSGSRFWSCSALWSVDPLFNNNLSYFVPILYSLQCLHKCLIRFSGSITFVFFERLSFYFLLDQICNFSVQPVYVNHSWVSNLCGQRIGGCYSGKNWFFTNAIDTNQRSP